MKTVVVALVMLSALLPSAAFAETLTGDVPDSGGIALVGWGGGSVESLITAAAAEGCGVSSVWGTSGGSFVGYSTTSPSFANAGFEGAFGSSPMPGSIFLLVCQPVAPLEELHAVPLQTVLLDLEDWDGGAVSEGACYEFDDGTIVVDRHFRPYSSSLAFGGGEFVGARTSAVVFPDEASARAEVARVRDAGIDGFIELYAIRDGYSLDAYLQYIDGKESRDLTTLGDGGFQAAANWSTGGGHDYAITSVGSIVLEATVTVGGDALATGNSPYSVELAELMVERTRAQLGRFELAVCLGYS